MEKKKKRYRLFIFALRDGRKLCKDCKMKEYPNRFPGDKVHVRAYGGSVTCSECGLVVTAAKPGRKKRENPFTRKLGAWVNEDFFRHMEFQRLSERKGHTEFIRGLLEKALDEMEKERPFHLQSWSYLKAEEEVKKQEKEEKKAERKRSY